MGKTNKWLVEGYYGWSDFDGPEDYNLQLVLDVDSFFTKEDIEHALCNHFNSYRTVAFNVKQIKT